MNGGKSMSASEITILFVVLGLILSGIIALNNLFGLKDRWHKWRASKIEEKVKQPDLRLYTEFVQREPRDGKYIVKIALGISNKGNATAGGPHITIRLPRYVSWNRYGLDGNYNEGMTRIPQEGSSMERHYGGDQTISIHPGSRRMITGIVLEYSQKNPELKDIEIYYEASAEDLHSTERKHTIKASEIREFLGLTEA